MNLIALALFGIGMIFIDIFTAKNRIVEASFTEISQELILSLITCLELASARPTQDRHSGRWFIRLHVD